MRTGEAIFRTCVCLAGCCAGLVFGETAARAPAVVIEEGPDWVPCTFTRDVEKGSALDFSARLDAPAGKYGWLKAVGDHFEFEKRPGVPQRFWGANVCMGMNFPSRRDADLLVDRLARLGYNSVRIHHHDRGLTVRGRGGVSLHAGNLDKFDYLYAAAIRKGLYLTTDLFVSRPVAWRDIGEDRDGEIGMHAFKGLTLFHEGAFANWAAFARLFLEHVNPYTGRAYKDEPALPLICLVNEGWLCTSWFEIRNMPCVVRAYDAWRDKMIAEHGADVLAHSLATNTLSANCYGWKNAATALFLAQCEKDTIGRKIAFLRSLGCKALLTNGNHGPNNAPNQMVRATALDFVDVHSYENHPKHLNKDPAKRWRLPSSCPNLNPMDAFDGICMAHIAWARVPGRPFAVTEWSFSGPAFHRGIAGLYGGALAGQQDWSGVWRFAHGHSAEGISGPFAAPGYFNTTDDPVMAVTDRTFANLFLRGDMPMLAPRINLVVDARALLTDGPKKGDWETMSSSPRKMAPTWRARVSCTTGPLPGAANYPLATWGVRFGSPDRPLPLDGLPENPSVRYDCAQRVFAVETDRTCGVFAPAGATVPCGPLGVTLRRCEATVSVTSLDGKPIPSSSRLLLSHVTDAHGTGCAFEDDACTVCVSFGRLPILVRDGSVQVTLRVDAPSAFSVYALSLDGRRRFMVPVSVSDGRLAFQAAVRGLDGKAVFEYEISREK